MRIISLREQPASYEIILKYIQSKWANDQSQKVYEDCLSHTIGAETMIPQWYVLEKSDEIIGCIGLITNDFISRMDLYPWICSLYIEPQYRGNGYSKQLIQKAVEDASKAGFKNVYLCTDHIGYYEKLGFEYLAQGYHPWGESSRIYRMELNL